MSKVDSPENYLIIRDTFITMTAEQNPGERMRAIFAANRPSRSEDTSSTKSGPRPVMTPTQGRARESLAGIDHQIAQRVHDPDYQRGRPLATMRRNGKTQFIDLKSANAVEVLREAVRQGDEIGSTGGRVELLREVKEMMVGVMGVPERSNLAIETRSAGGGRKSLARREIDRQAEVEIVDRQTRGLVAGVIGNTALILDQRREALVAAVATRAIGAMGKIAEQIITVRGAIELLGSGKLGSALEQTKTTTEHFMSRPLGLGRLFGGGRGEQLVSRTTVQGGKKVASVPPGTRLTYVSEPDQPITIRSSAVAGSVVHAEGKHASARWETGPGYSSGQASGERVDVVSIGAAIGGMDIGGGGGSSLSFEVGDLGSFDF